MISYNIATRGYLVDLNKALMPVLRVPRHAGGTGFFTFCLVGMKTLTETKLLKTLLIKELKQMGKCK